MNMTDPIADLLTRLRNANSARHGEMQVPASRMKMEILKVLHQEGFIESFQKTEDGRQGMLRVVLKQGSHKDRVITRLTRVSSPGRRVYVSKNDVPRILGGLGIAILSTSKGVLTDSEARKQGVGGELLCRVW